MLKKKQLILKNKHTKYLPRSLSLSPSFFSPQKKEFENKKIQNFILTQLETWKLVHTWNFNFHPNSFLLFFFFINFHKIFINTNNFFKKNRLIIKYSIINAKLSFLLTGWIMKFQYCNWLNCCWKKLNLLDHLDDNWKKLYFFSLFFFVWLFVSVSIRFKLIIVCITFILINWLTSSSSLATEFYHFIWYFFLLLIYRQISSGNKHNLTSKPKQKLLI